MDKIRKQRELASSKVAAASAATISTNKEMKTSQPIVEDELEKSAEDSELWSTPNSSMKINDEPAAPTKQTNTSVQLIQDISNASDSFKSSTEGEEEENTTLDETVQDGQNFFRASKQTRGIMMSSHNVSSLNEIETSTTAAALVANNKRRKTVISKNIRIPGGDEDGNANSSLVTVPNTATYSIDFSHASREQMVAGPKELFNKNVNKLTTF